MRELLEMKADVEFLKTAFGQSLRIGPVAEIDAQRGYRIKTAERPDGRPVLSPWLPHPETGKTSVPLKMGQTVGYIVPSGALREALVFRGGYGKGNESPNSDMDANVFSDAGVTVTVAAGALVIEAGGSTFRMSGAGVEIEAGGVTFKLTDGGFAQAGGAVTHDSKNIGSSHVHGGVARGAATTNGPQ